MSLQMKSIQLKGPAPAVVAMTTDAAASTAECKKSECKTSIEEAATKEAEATAEATCLD